MGEVRRGVRRGEEGGGAAGGKALVGRSTVVVREGGQWIFYAGTI
jgi:hypothetical protein